MTEEESAFVEEMGQALAGYGMTPMAGRIYRFFREIAERGLVAIEDRPEASKARLQEFRDVFAFVEREVPLIVDRFLREHAGQAGRKDPS